MTTLKNEWMIFGQEYVKNGNNGTKAYMIAYPNCTEETARRNASTLLTKTDVQEYIKELQDKIEDKSIMSAKDRMIFLTNVVNGIMEGQEKVCGSDRLKALDILNKMSGEYVIKTEIKDVTPKWFKK